jgi:lysophospholipase L1-like esterase
MGELAEANHIHVFIPEMTPVCDCVRPLSGLRTVERIRELNGLIAVLCHEKKWTLLRFNVPLADVNGLMRAELTVDGVHPNDKGYALLAPIVEDSLRLYR